MFLKGFSSGTCFCNGFNPCKSEVVEKYEHSMHEEENIFDDDEDDTVTVSG